MKTGSEFHVGIVGLGSMGMGAALSCVRAGLSTWGADLNSNACATLKEAGAPPLRVRRESRLRPAASLAQLEFPAVPP